MSRRSRWIVALAALIVGPTSLATCGGDDGPSEPEVEPGVLEVRLTGRNEVLAGVLVEIEGPVDAVESSGLTVTDAPTSSGIRAIVEGPLQPGLLFRIRVPDVNDPGGWTVRVLQVAEPVSFDQLAPSGWGAFVSP